MGFSDHSSPHAGAISYLQAGGSGYETGGKHKPDDEEDLFPFFSTSCYSGYGDGAKVRMNGEGNC